MGGPRSVVMEAASMVDPVVTSCKKKTRKKLEGGREAEEDIKKSFNQNLKCYYHVNDFIDYCVSLDDKCKELADLYTKFKQGKKRIYK